MLDLTARGPYRLTSLIMHELFLHLRDIIQNFKSLILCLIPWKFAILTSKDSLYLHLLIFLPAHRSYPEKLFWENRLYMFLSVFSCIFHDFLPGKRTVFEKWWMGSHFHHNKSPLNVNKPSKNQALAKISSIQVEARFKQSFVFQH